MNKTFKAKYTGDYYKVYLLKGEVYDVIEETDDGMYKVYIDDLDDWFLFSKSDFERI